MTDPLATEKRYLKRNLKKLSKEHPGKYLLVKGEAVHGAYETFEEGAREGTQQFGKGPFLVRSVLRPDDPPPTMIPNLMLGVPLVTDIQRSV